jgi:hypothetical protein
MTLKKPVLLALISVSVAQVVHAATFKTNDLYLGLTQAAAQNDYIIDLGQPSAVGARGSAPMDLSASFSTATFNSVFNSGPNGVVLAIVGGDNVFNQTEIWATQVRVGGAGNPAVAGSSLSALHTSTQLSGGAVAISSIAANTGGLPSAGNSTLDPNKTYTSQIDQTGSGNNFIGKTGVNPTGAFDETGILYMDLYHATVASNYTYMGYFTVDVSGGHLTFTPSGAPNTGGPPPRPTLTFVKGAVGSTFTNLISFPTANNATYTLYFTNAVGLTTPVSNWPTAGSLIGDGTTRTFTNSSTDANRFYSVGAH